MGTRGCGIRRSGKASTVLRAADGQFARALGAVAGSEQVPRVAIFDDGRIMGVLDTAFQPQRVRLVICVREAWATGGSNHRFDQKCAKAVGDLCPSCGYC